MANKIWDFCQLFINYDEDYKKNPGKFEFIAVPVADWISEHCLNEE